MNARGAALVCLMCTLACQAASKSAPDAAPAGPQPPAAQAVPPAEAAPSAPRPARPAPLRSVSVKETSLVDAALHAGAKLTSPRALELPRQATLTLDFEHGARVLLVGPARALVNLSEEDLLLLGLGSVSVDLPPSAPTPRSGFALFTPAGKLTLVRGGRFAMRVFEDGSSQGYVVAGSATLHVLGADAKVERVLLGAGDQFQHAPGRAPQRTKHTASTLEQAAQLAQGLKPNAAQRRALDPQRLAAQLAAQSSATAPLRLRQARLVEEHLTSVRARDAGAELLGDLQRAIADTAAELAEQRVGLRLALGQRAAALQTPAQGGDDEPSVEARALLAR